MPWTLSNRADPIARDIADRHYNRQKPGTPQFVPPGRCLVLRCPGAFWVTSWPFAEFVQHAWGGPGSCSAFRRESGPLASLLVERALAATSWRWTAPDIACAACARHGRVSRIAMVTFIDEDKVKRKRDPGRCFRRAGFVECEERTAGGLVVLHIDRGALPAAEAPIGAQMEMGT